MTKRFISFMLAVIMVISVLPVQAFATESTEVPIISVENVYAAPGQGNVEVEVSIENNNGIFGSILTLEYDSDLTLISAVSGDAFSELVMTNPGSFASPCNFVWDGQAEPATNDGTILKLTFNVSDTAEANKKLNIKVSYLDGDIVDGDFNEISPMVINGCVTIIDYIPGDVNGDGVVNTVDITWIRRYRAGGYGVTINEAAADVNDDNKINTIDITMIRRYRAGGYGVKLLPHTPRCSHSNLTAFAAEAATCTDAGNFAYWYCPNCEKCFSDADATTEISLADAVIAAKGHTEVVIPDVLPTETEWGSTGGVKCSVCNLVITEPTPVKPIAPDEVLIKYDFTSTLSSDAYLPTAIAKALAAGKIYMQEGPVNVTNAAYSNLQKVENSVIPGYEFQGWYDSAADSADKVTAIAKGTNGNVTLYARWKKTEYVVSFKSPLKLIDPQTRTIDQTTQLPKTEDMKLSYYIFLGWSDASGNIIEEIPAGVGNITVYANYTSQTRNVAYAEDYEEQAPLIYFDEENGQYLFVYNIGRIEKVPLKQLNTKDWTLGGGEDSLTVQSETFGSQTIGENEAKEINTIVSNATTHSSSWTLSQDWNELLTEMDGGSQSVAEGTVIAISDGTSKAFASEGSTYVGGSFHTSNDSKITSKTITDDSYKNSASLEAGLSYGPAKVNAKISGEQAHSEHQEDYKETNSSLQTSAEWNSSSGYSASENLNHTESRTNEVLKQAQSEWKHEISKAIGEEKSKTSEEASSTSQTDGYTSTVGFFNEKTESFSLTETRVFTTQGSYRYVVYGTAYVYAMVGYDIKTGSFFVETVSALADDYTTGFDYSYDGSFTDYNNGVLPFEIPVDIYNYVYEKTAMTDGVVISREGIVTDYLGTATEVLIPDVRCFDNGDSTYEVVPVVGIDDEMNGIAGNADIKAIKLGNKISTIPNGAFLNCSSLDTIAFNKLTSIGNNAFKGCKSLNNLSLSSDLVALGTSAFEDIQNVTIYASKSSVAQNAVSSGARSVSVYLKDLNDSEITSMGNNKMVASDKTDTLLAIYGDGKVYENICIESRAAKTVINRITFKDNTTTPLVLESSDIELFAVDIDNAPSPAVHLKEDSTNVVIKGISNISTNGDIAILSKALTVSLPGTVTETTKLNVTSGDIVVCGAVDELKSFRYLVVSPGEIRSITETEYNNILDTHTITFNANGGVVKIPSITATYGSEITEMPIPEWEGYTFLGWYDKNGTEVGVGDVFNYTEDIVLKAYWRTGYVLESEVPDGAEIVSGSEKWTYDLITNITSDKSSVDGYTLTGYEYGDWSEWSTTKATASESREVEVRTVIDQEGYYEYNYSRYINNTAIGGNSAWSIYHYCQTCASNYYGTSTSYWSQDWSSWTTGWSKTRRNDIGDWSCGCGKSGNKYEGLWYYESSRYIEPVTHEEYRYRDKIYYHTKTEQKESSVAVTPSDSIVNVQKWVKYIIKDNYTAEAFTITFNTNGGTVSPTSKQVYFGSAYGDLPTPTKTGFAFKGWYTEQSGGSEVTSYTILSTVGDKTLYAQWKINSYTATWNVPTGASIVVKRTSSPRAGAAIGAIQSGQAVYYGDVLSITYAANTGYTLTGNGKTSITVSGNILPEHVYANVSPNSYTYNVVYVSSNGTSLGSTTITKAYNTTNTVTPKEFSGYDTPAAQSVKWDSTSAKTITFVYTPTAVAFTEKSGISFEANAKQKYDHGYVALIEYQNRTETSIQIRVTWTHDIGYEKEDSYLCHGVNLKVSSGNVSTTKEILGYLYDGNIGTHTATTDWITISLESADTSSLDIVLRLWQINSNGTDMTAYSGYPDFNATWTIAIPKY